MRSSLAIETEPVGLKPKDRATAKQDRLDPLNPHSLGAWLRHHVQQPPKGYDDLNRGTASIDEQVRAYRHQLVDYVETAKHLIPPHQLIEDLHEMTAGLARAFTSAHK